MKRKARTSTLAVVGLVVLAAAAFYLLTGGKNAGVVHADTGITTQKAANAAGARVLPSDPKLKVEPK